MDREHLGCSASYQAFFS